LTNSEIATLLNAEYLADSDENTDDRENMIVSDRAVYSDTSGLGVSTSTYVWEDMINYIGRREMFTGISEP
jgi:hypothetical protein